MSVRSFNLITSNLGQAQAEQLPPGFRFLRPLSQCEQNLEDLITEIQRDPWPVPTGKRALRSLGVAMSLSASLLEVTYPNVAGRIMVFTAGPATQGPGMVIDEDQSNVIRGWHDIEKVQGELINFHRDQCKINAFERKCVI